MTKTNHDYPEVHPKASVLLVAGNVGRREGFYDLLSRNGRHVIAVHSGICAMDVLKHERPGLILVDADQARPRGSMQEFIERIRMFDSRLPIVLLAESNGMPRATAEVQACLSPSVPEEQLLRTVEQWLTTAPPERHERWPGTILIVDDEPKLRLILHDFLEPHGFSVLTAGSGEEALARLVQASPTIVLLDINMPGLDGLLVLKKIKALRPQSVVIMITGLEDEQLMEEALKLGAHDYIVKPFDLAYLESTLLSRMILGHAA